MRSLDTGNTLTDSRTRELIGPVYKKAVEFNAQVSTIGDFEAKVMVERGNAPLSDGRLLFVKADLDAKCFTIKVNDKIVQIGNNVVEVFVTEVQPGIHWGAAQGLLVSYADREARL